MQNLKSIDNAGVMNTSALKKINKVKSDLSVYRRQFEPLWKKEESAYYGDIWINVTNYRPFENDLFEIIEGAVPLLTDSMSSAIVKTDNDDQVEQTDILTKAFEWTLNDQNFPILKPILIRNSLIGGPGWLHVYWDKHADKGNGRQMFEVLPWDCVWIDGSACLIEDAKKAYFKVKRSKDWLKRAYPMYKEEIEKMKSFQNAHSEDRQASELFDLAQRTKRKSPQPYNDDDLLELEISWVQDCSMMKIPQGQTTQEIAEEHEALINGDGMDVSIYQDHDGHNEGHFMKRAEIMDQIGLAPDASIEEAGQVIQQILEQSPESGADELLLQLTILDSHMEEHVALKRENPNGEMPKYKDDWRVIEKIKNLVVYDDSPREESCEIPLVPWYAYKDATIYGINEIRNLYDSQSMQAVMSYKVYKGLQKVANPAKLVDIETGLKPKDITNEDGAIYMVPQGTSIRNIAPGEISPQVERFASERAMKMKNISGISAASDGKIPHRNASGFLVDKLEQQALGRVRLKDRNDQYYSTRRLCKIVISNILQYWTGEKKIRLSNGLGKTLESAVYNPLEMQDIEYEITISPGSMAGVDKDAFNSMLLKLVEFGALDMQSMLTVAEIPMKDKLLGLVEQKINIEQQMQEMQSQIEQAQMENIKLKAQISLELLNPEELKIYQEIQRQEQLEELNSNQAVDLTEGV